jgi:hypothetical protein
VTIIAGFKCYDGVVLCADTQETTSIGGVPLTKRNVPKLRFHERGAVELQMAGGVDLAVAFCGAGDGPFIDKLADNAWKEVHLRKSCSSAWDAATAIEESIKDTYEEFGRIYQVGQCPQAELLYAVKAPGDVLLFYALGPVVNEVDTVHSGGCGYYMADFLAQRMYSKSLSMHQCVILAAYILFQAKEHVDGCGGASHIAVLREDKSSGLVGWQQLEAITKLLEYVDGEAGKIILSAPDLEISDDEFSNQMDDLIRWAKEFRAVNREELRKSLVFWDSFRKGFLGPDSEIDSLGLPMSKPKESGDEEPQS